MFTLSTHEVKNPIGTLLTGWTSVVFPKEHVMSSSSTATHEQSSYKMHMSCNGASKCGNWSGINIAAMVLGFVFFWPVGLIILFWILTGNHVKDLPQAIRYHWSNLSGYWRATDGFSNGKSDNVVFNEYQQTQYDRIHELKEEIKSRAQRFKDYRANAKRHADEEEFNQFMSDGPNNNNA